MYLNKGVETKKKKQKLNELYDAKKMKKNKNKNETPSIYTYILFRKRKN